jgi:hypothetical protein
MLIYITAPPNKKPKKIISRLHPLASRLHLLPRRHLTSHPLCLFVCSSVRLFLWLVVASSLCPLSSCPVPSRRRATSLRYVLSLVVPLVVIESSRRRISSCRVVVSRPLMQLVTPALFDYCVYCCHRAAAATIAVAVPPPPPPPPCHAVLLPPPPCRRALSRSRSRSRCSSGSIRHCHCDST